MNRFAYAAAAAALFACAPVEAATYTVDQTLDPGGFTTGPGATFTSGFSPETSVTLGAGDVLEWTITLAEGRSITLDGLLTVYVPLSYLPPSPFGLVSATSVYELLDENGTVFLTSLPKSYTNFAFLGSYAFAQDFAEDVSGLITFYGVRQIITIDALGPDAPAATTYGNPFLRAVGDRGISISAAVPEPATWAMMIGGFGLVGATMRRRARIALA